MSEESEQVRLARIEEKFNHMDATLTTMNNRLAAWDKMAVILDINNREFPKMKEKLDDVQKMAATHQDTLADHTVKLSRALSDVDSLKASRARLKGWLTGVGAAGTILGWLGWDLFKKQ